MQEFKSAREQEDKSPPLRSGSWGHDMYNITDELGTLNAGLIVSGDIVCILSAVLAKYAGHAGHVRQTSADVRQRDPTLPDILSGRVQYTENVRQGRKELLVIN